MQDVRKKALKVGLSIRYFFLAKRRRKNTDILM